MRATRRPCGDRPSIRFLRVAHGTPVGARPALAPVFFGTFSLRAQLIKRDPGQVSIPRRVRQNVSDQTLFFQRKGRCVQ